MGPSQEIMEEINKTKKVKKVVASCGSMAASGGYYIASAADLIMANPGTATGSIGVIMQLANVEQLTKKLGVDFFDIKAGALKDMGSPFKPLTPEERAVFQSLLNNIHEQFINDVAKNRKLPVDKVRSLADGRVFTGQEAKGLGLIDDAGKLQRRRRTCRPPGRHQGKNRDGVCREEGLFPVESDPGPGSGKEAGIPDRPFS